jgi:ketosteroid isomerase-like protein
MTMETAQIYDVIDGRISRIRIFLDHSEALKAVGLEEQAVPDESTSPGLVELTRHLFELANNQDFDAALEFYVPHAFWRGTVDDAEGVEAIRDLLVSYFSAFEELRVVLDDVVDFGNGVILIESRHVGRLLGGGALAERRAFVYEFVNGRVVRATDYVDIDEARAAAERRAQERG